MQLSMFSSQEPPAVVFDCQTSGRYGFGVGKIASTNRCIGHQAVFRARKVRRLTPRECERLQGYPDDYTLIQTTTVRELEADMFAYLRVARPDLPDDEILRLAKDGPRYKVLGNSMAVPVMRWIGRRIAIVDALPS